MIGVYGGTFDPVHLGHLRTALEVMQGVGLDEVRFIPLYRAVHREQPRVSGALRLRMLQAAVAEQPGFLVDDRELRRQGDSYMVDTLNSLRAEIGGRSLCLILGGDAFSHFLNWHRPMEILDLAHLIVMQRPAQEEYADLALQALLTERQSQESAALRRQPAGRILFQPVTQLDISSTRLRALLAAGLSPRFLVPEAVRRIIQQQNLYSG